MDHISIASESQENIHVQSKIDDFFDRFQIGTLLHRCGVRKRHGHGVRSLTQAITEILTGHIDILQLRNGLINILDYKPKAKSEKPYTQLTLYALALSRLTGLRLFDFKCAWFDEHHYFEFFPLHMVHKLKSW